MSLRVACLGAGYFARFHHDAWTRIQGATLCAIADTNMDRAQEASPKGTQAFDDLRTMLEATAPDIVDIVTPPDTHATAIRICLAAGVKAIICQKPFASSLHEAEALAAEAEACGKPLIIHENFRFQPWFRQIKRSLEDGTLGDVHQMTFRLRTGDGQGPDAYLDRQPYFQTMPRLFIHETGVHYIDTFRFLLGPIRAVYADLRKMNPVLAGEDAAYVVFEFDGGVRGILDANRHLDHVTTNTRLTFGEALVEGTQASLTLDGGGGLNHRDFGAQSTRSVLDAKPWGGFAGDCVFQLQSHVVAALNGQGVFENLAANYLSVRRVEEAIYLSAERGARVIL